ncbi:MAG TPA: 3-oxoacyl-ACP synthase [Chryseosolibacter sp.]|nr:3-oxoacyl-ACP synthase [Chryseosolibacter sp.]
MHERIAAAQTAIEGLQHDANEETKSSAGDKYETGRAMMQLEMEKHGQQLSEARRSKQALEKMDVTRPYSETHPGCIVKTNHGNFFLAISAGPFTVAGETFVSISPGSPLGSKLLNCKAGDVVSVNNREYKVLEVY